MAGYTGSPLLLSDQPRLSYLEANVLYTAPWVQGASSLLTGAQEDVAGQAHPPDTGGSPALMVVMELFESTAGTGEIVCFLEKTQLAWILMFM